MKDNRRYSNRMALVVVNCFQKLLSSWWRTTVSHWLTSYNELWIAFKNYYLRDEGQPAKDDIQALNSCELLSKIIIFVMKDNHLQKVDAIPIVVNCFQKLLSSWWRTTKSFNNIFNQVLWIAFKNYYLRDEGQRHPYFCALHRCCELLSKIIIFVMKDNTHSASMRSFWVVNCFQKLLSSWWRTTFQRQYHPSLSLWIAFKNYYLRDEGQRDVI